MNINYLYALLFRCLKSNYKHIDVIVIYSIIYTQNSETCPTESGRHGDILAYMMSD